MLALIDIKSEVKKTYLKLGPGRLGIAQRIHNLALGSRELRRALKVLECLCDLALLQQQLRHGCDGNIALGVDDQRLFAQLLRIVKVIFPLEERETFMPSGLLDFSISIAVSNFSMASWYFCWSSSSSP
jgi:hypothetical protein